MNIALFLAAGILWVAGYLVGMGFVKETTLMPSKIVFPPKILFYLCGAPKSSNNANGAMEIRPFGSQIMGIALGIYSVILSIWELDSEIFLTGLILTITGVYLVVYLVTIRKVGT